MLEARERVSESSPTLDQHWTAREIRRFAALASDATAAAPFELAELWQPVCAGQLRIVDTFFSSERCLLVLSARRGRALPRRRKQILELLLLGSRPKVVAVELKLSPSSVSGALAQCLGALGLSDGTAGLPLVLLMAARASVRGERFEARMSPLCSDGSELQVVSLARPDFHLRSVLSGAEFEVIRQMLEGKSHEQISGTRKTSVRTIANQLASAYRKLGISGRLELMDEVANHAAS